MLPSDPKRTYLRSVRDVRSRHGLSGYLRLMNFPAEWEAWGMLPRSFGSEQSVLYEPGHEGASEHDRHSVFQWWLRQNPPTETLV